ncbi:MULTISPECIES: GAF and ANTAR domain-containing protein [Pseudarthrobacter]|uniref:GAF and ANTAR domain-containing protein n=1 Tax=Pseudarthrobacter TaxID=1742993 RepID=UPI0012FBCEA8|nr:MULTISPECIES: GAF and ANTAR domain-containing protein [Pseudarthrobacter]MEA3552344.1 GAF and ANTAR domain-containing protein [Pseudarthrobacter sp. C1]MUU72129.1 GAF domain-containing protein [Pseudarthrobacter sp. GA104]WPU08866.1 GAF and ANTAR domain-containing protein [Pseudarthrobacter oxydans]
MAKESTLTASDQMQDLLLESPGFPEFLLGLATLSASMAGADGQVTCTITLERDGGLSTVASSSEEGRRLDETQYSFGEGPCLTAARLQRLVWVPDLAGDERWSAYAEAAAQEGVRSVLAVPISTDASSRASLNCYAGTTSAFNEGTVVLLEQHAASMSRVLRIALRLHGADVHPEHLRAALKSRATVDAAVSLIMLQHRGGRDGALEILRLAAKSSNRKIHVIAQNIVRGAELPALPNDRV